MILLTKYLLFLIKMKTKDDIIREQTMNDDLQAIERVRGVKLELDRTEISYKLKIHCGQINDSIAELNGAEIKLRELINNEMNHVDTWKLKRKETFHKLNEYELVHPFSQMI